MKKSFIFFLLCSIIALLFASFFSSTDIHLLDQKEESIIKKGKTFWNWHSPHGKLAIHYLEKGEGTNHLFFIHGFRAHTFTWNHLVEPLAKAGFHVWAIDFIGYGLSDKPDDAPYDFHFFITQLKEFMQAKGIKQAHLVGNSLGGGIALNLAIQHPSYVQSLTLISALGYPLHLPTYLSIARHIDRLWPPFLGPTWVKKTLENVVYDKKKVSDEQVKAYCLPYQLSGGILSTLLTLRQYNNQHLEEMQKAYPSLQKPILLIWGEDDPLIPLDHFYQFTKDFPNADYLLLKKCGHIPQEEEPQHVLKVIKNFLYRLN
jgi:pimeloyl-ACP methyl ester carboxylesterase